MQYRAARPRRGILGRHAAARPRRSIVARFSWISTSTLLLREWALASGGLWPKRSPSLTSTSCGNTRTPCGWVRPRGFSPLIFRRGRCAGLPPSSLGCRPMASWRWRPIRRTTSGWALAAAASSATMARPSRASAWGHLPSKTWLKPSCATVAVDCGLGRGRGWSPTSRDTHHRAWSSARSWLVRS